eukprot:10277121-Alexandrium_andersonii.AAC.1
MGHVIFLAEPRVFEAAVGVTSRVTECLLSDAASRASQASALPILAAWDCEPLYDTIHREDCSEMPMGKL